MDYQKSVDLLNQAIAEELLSVDQYLYFHFHCEDRGYVPLAKIFQRIAIAEMMHVDKLAQRALFLKGDVNMVHADKIQQITNVEDMLKCAKALEAKSVKDYNQFATFSAENSDSRTKTLFEELVKDEEDHYDIYDKEIDNLAEFGDSYLALQSIERSKEAGRGPVPE